MSSRRQTCQLPMLLLLLLLVLALSLAAVTTCPSVVAACATAVQREQWRPAWRHTLQRRLLGRRQQQLRLVPRVWLSVPMTFPVSVAAQVGGRRQRRWAHGWVVLLQATLACRRTISLRCQHSRGISGAVLVSASGLQRQAWRPALLRRQHPCVLSIGL